MDDELQGKADSTGHGRAGKQLPPSTSFNDDDRQRATICTAKTFPSLDHGLGLQWLMRVHYSVLITIKSELKRKSESRLNLVFDFATHDATPDECNSIQPWWSSACIVASQRVQQLIREKPINMRKGRGRGAGRWSRSRGIISIVLLLHSPRTWKESATWLVNICKIFCHYWELKRLPLISCDRSSWFIFGLLWLRRWYSHSGQFVWPAN